MFNQFNHQLGTQYAMFNQQHKHKYDTQFFQQQHCLNSQPNNNNFHPSFDVSSHIGAHQLLPMAGGGNNVHPPQFFISSKTFNGERAGYVFRTSTEGTGYYLDVQTPLPQKFINNDNTATLAKKEQKAKAERERRKRKFYRKFVDDNQEIQKKVEIVNMDQLTKIMESNRSKDADEANLFEPVTQLMKVGLVRNPSTRGKNLSNLYDGAVVKYSDGTLSAVPVEQFKLEQGIPCMAKDGSHKGAEAMFAERLTNPISVPMFNSEHMTRTIVIIRWESDKKLCIKSIEQVWARPPRNIVPVNRYVPGQSDFSGTVTKEKVSKQLKEYYENICEAGKKRFVFPKGMGILQSEAEIVKPKYFLIQGIGQWERQNLLHQLGQSTMYLNSGGSFGRSKELLIGIVKKAVFLAIDDLDQDPSGLTGSSADAIKEHIMEHIINHMPELKKWWSDAIFKDVLNDERLVGVHKPDFTLPNLRWGILLAIKNDPSGNGRSATAIKKYMVNTLLFNENMWIDKEYVDVLEDAVNNGVILERLERIPLGQMMARSDSSSRKSGGMSTVTVELSLIYDILRGNIWGSLPQLDVMDSANHDDADRSLYLRILKDSEQRMSVATCLKERREKRGICKELGCENFVKTEFHKLQVCWQHAPTNLRKEVSEKRKRKRDESKGQLCYSVAPPPWCRTCQRTLGLRGTCLHCMS